MYYTYTLYCREMPFCKCCNLVCVCVYFSCIWWDQPICCYRDSETVKKVGEKTTSAFQPWQGKPLRTPAQPLGLTRQCNVGEVKCAQHLYHSRWGEIVTFMGGRIGSGSVAFLLCIIVRHYWVIWSLMRNHMQNQKWWALYRITNGTTYGCQLSYAELLVLKASEWGKSTLLVYISFSSKIWVCILLLLTLSGKNCPEYWDQLLALLHWIKALKVLT